MLNLRSRLTALERQRPRTTTLLGSVEEHYVGGWQKIDADRCSEHEECAFRSTLDWGSIGRLVIMEWTDGCTWLE